MPAIDLPGSWLTYNVRIFYPEDEEPLTADQVRKGIEARFLVAAQVTGGDIANACPKHPNGRDGKCFTCANVADCKCATDAWCPTHGPNLESNP